MKILAVSPRPPSPANKADAMTVNKMVRFLANKGHEVDLICFVGDANEDRLIRDELKEVCRSIDTIVLPTWKSIIQTACGLFDSLPLQVSYYHSVRMQQLVENKTLVRNYDIVYTHLIRMAEYTRGLKLPKILGMQVSQALNLGRMIKYNSNPFLRLFYKIEFAKVRPYEAKVTNDFDRVLLCGQPDIDTISKTASARNALVCPHGQNIPPSSELSKIQKQSGIIAMSGVMSTHTNVEAATWFAKEIFPLVQRKYPKTEFWIIGRNPNRRVRNLQRDRKIKVIGEVYNLYEWLGKASIAVAPVRIAAGMQNKIVQAMACELPVVSTSAANEGVNAKPNEQIIIQDDPKQFSAAVIELLDDKEKRDKIGKAARQFVENNWTWEHHFDREEKIFFEVIEMNKNEKSLSATEIENGSESKSQ